MKHPAFEELCYKLRVTAQEHGQKALDDAVIVGMHWDIDFVTGIPYIHCPTLAYHTLGNVAYKVARTFEDSVEKEKE